MVDEYRCPPVALCVWQGDALIVVGVAVRRRCPVYVFIAYYEHFRVRRMASLLLQLGEVKYALYSVRCVSRVVRLYIESNIPGFSLHLLRWRMVFDELQYIPFVIHVYTVLFCGFEYSRPVQCA